MSDSAARQLALDTNQSFIVQAPAGSGKTELLTQRVLKLLAQVQSPEEILAVTFTRKAAAQMRERLLLALQNAQATPIEPVLDHEKTTWRLACAVLQRDEKLQWQIQKNPNRLRIVTIDALCAHIVNRLPIMSHFGTMPEIVENAKNYYEKAVEMLLVETQQDETWVDALKTLLLHLDNRITVLSQLFVNLLSKRDQWLAYLVNMQFKEHLAVTLENSLQTIIIDHLVALAAQFSEEDQQSLLHILQTAARMQQLQNPTALHDDLLWLNQEFFPLPTLEDLPLWQSVVELCLTQQDTWRKSFTQKMGFPSPSEAKDKTEKSIRKVHKDHAIALIEKFSINERLLELLTETRTLPPLQLSIQQLEILNALADLLPVLLAYLQLVFQAEGKVDFTEINLRALQALGDELVPSDIALALDYQLHHILIDEYQDTSVIQQRLFEKLVTGWQVGDGRTLFLVGDPMQSIYRFRGAEVSLFMRTQQQGLNGITLQNLRLEANFRSTDKIVSWLNATFKHIFPSNKDITLGRVCYTPAVAHQETTAQQAVIIYPHLKNAASQNSHIVELIIQTYQNSPEQSIAVLVRRKKDLAPLVMALKTLKMPFIAHEVEHLVNRSHVIDLMSLLKATTDWADTIAWYAILRAPWLGLSLADLLVLARHNLTGLLWEVLTRFNEIDELSQNARQRLSRFVPLLQLWFNQRGRNYLSQWLRGLWLAIGGPQCYGQPHFIKDIDLTLKLIEEYSPGGVLADIPLLEAKLANLYGDVSSVMQAEISTHPVIELMTIHKAKGLEFDTVILPHLETKTVQHDPALLLWFERQHLAGLDLILAPRRSQEEKFDSLYRYVDQQIRKKNHYEMARLLYVGATRAKHTLHLVGECEIVTDEIKTPPNGSFWQLLWPHIQPAVQAWQQKIACLTTESTAEPIATTVQPLQRLLVTWEPPVLVQQKLTAQLQQPVISQANLPVVHGEYFYKSAGIVFHRLLQEWGNLQEASEKISPKIHFACQLALKRMGLVGEQLRSAIELVLKGVENMLADSQGKWILDNTHTQRKTEWQLSIQEPGRIKNYIIDYAFVDSQGTQWIVDYKLSGDQEIQPYRQQLQNYKEILLALHDRPVRCGLYFPLLPAWWEMT